MGIWNVPLEYNLTLACPPSLVHCRLMIPYWSNARSNSEQLTVAMPQGWMTGHTCPPPSSCLHPEGGGREKGGKGQEGGREGIKGRGGKEGGGLKGRERGSGRNQGGRER